MSEIDKEKKDDDDKKIYIAPKVESEEILMASLGATCNGMTGGGRKADVPSGCSTLKT